MKLPLLLAVSALVTGCAALPPPAPEAIDASPWARPAGPAGLPAPPWKHQVFPGKPATRYSYERRDGRPAVAAVARASASMLRQQLRVAPGDLGRIRFSWWVPALIEGADLSSRDRDDAPVRIVLVFEGDRSRFSARDAALSELARAVTGEELPYATLMYTWSERRPPEAVVRAPRTDRIRKIVVESGPARLGRWLDYERDIRADYLRAFGEPPGALLGVGLMTDGDNTRSRARAWYGPLQLLPPAPAVQPPVPGNPF